MNLENHLCQYIYYQKDIQHEHGAPKNLLLDLLAAKIRAWGDTAASSAAQGSDGSYRGQWWDPRAETVTWHDVTFKEALLTVWMSSVWSTIYFTISGSGIVTKTTLDNTTTVKITSMVSGITNQVIDIAGTKQLLEWEILGQVCCERPGSCQRPPILANEIQQDWNINCSRFVARLKSSFVLHQKCYRINLLIRV